MFSSMIGSSAASSRALSSWISRCGYRAEFGGVERSRAGASSGYAGGYVTERRRAASKAGQYRKGRVEVTAVRGRAVQWNAGLPLHQQVGLRGSESSPSCCVTSNAIEIRYEVSDMSTWVSARTATEPGVSLPICLPVISSGKMESRTSRSSFCSSRPILYGDISVFPYSRYADNQCEFKTVGLSEPRRTLAPSSLASLATSATYWR